MAYLLNPVESSTKNQIELECKDYLSKPLEEQGSLGLRKLTAEELDEYRNLNKLTLTTSEMVNKRLLQKCKAKLQPKYK